MIIRYHRLFEKRYRKLSPELQRKVDSAVGIFVRAPFAPRLRNHGLIGVLLGKRAISVTGDVRIIYEMEGDHLLVLFLDVGTHTQVY